MPTATPSCHWSVFGDYERPAAVDPAAAPLKALVVAGSPEPSSPALVAALAAAANYIVAADKGADALFAASIAPQVFVGDFDSVGEKAAAWAHACAATDISFPAEKYATDLSLAIGCAAHEAARRGAPLDLTVTCATGGRLDQQLAVVGLLAQAPAAAARLVEDSFEMRVLAPTGTPDWELEDAAPGQTFSVIALAPGTRVDIQGAKWPLQNYSLPLLADLGISNVVERKGAKVTCKCGCLAVVLLK